jgi:hypothetical protein
MAASQKLFYDDEIDALNQMVSNSERTTKEVAQFLFPDMSSESAYAKLKACLSPTGDQRLRFGQVLAAMRFCGHYDPLYHACDETLHARPSRVAPEDEQVRIVEVIGAAASTLERAMAQLDRLRDRQPQRTRR